MAKAATSLKVTQPAVSKAVGDLEAALRVRLFDRGPQGVVLTAYGDVLLKSGVVVFDELRQGIRSIEFLADPTSGELTVGCPESIAATILPAVIQQFSAKYPRVVIRVEDVPSPVNVLPLLSGRTCDLVISRLNPPLPRDQFPDALMVDVLFDDELIVATGLHNPLARRRKISLAELAEEPWILMAPHTFNYRGVAEAFEKRGLKPPKVTVETYSVHLRTHLLAHGRYVTALPKSVLHFNASHFALKMLPVALPIRPWPVALVMLKNRTRSPVVDRFVDCVRDFAKPWRPGVFPA
jgi:DNA-binding transcriptional LysR family regulator